MCFLYRFAACSLIVLCIVACSSENNKAQIPAADSAGDTSPVPGDVLVSASLGDASNLNHML